MSGGTGLDRAGYKQISKNVDAKVITSTMSGAAVTGDWFCVEVLSSKANIATFTAAGITGSSLIGSSGVDHPHGASFSGGSITALKLSAKSTGHKLIAYTRVVL